MKIGDVLADEMIELCVTIRIAIGIEIYTLPLTEIFKTGKIANWRIQLNIEILPGGIRYFKSEIRRITRNIPVL